MTFDMACLPSHPFHTLHETKLTLSPCVCGCRMCERSMAEIHGAHICERGDSENPLFSAASSYDLQSPKQRIHCIEELLSGALVAAKFLSKYEVRSIIL